MSVMKGLQDALRKARAEYTRFKALMEKAEESCKALEHAVERESNQVQLPFGNGKK